MYLLLNVVSCYKIRHSESRLHAHTSLNSPGQALCHQLQVSIQTRLRTVLVAKHTHKALAALSILVPPAVGTQVPPISEGRLLAVDLGVGPALPCLVPELEPLVIGSHVKGLPGGLRNKSYGDCDQRLCPWHLPVLCKPQDHRSSLAQGWARGHCR